MLLHKPLSITFSPSPNPHRRPASSRDSPHAAIMESALVTTGFLTGLRLPLFTSDLVKTEQVQRRKDGCMMLQPVQEENDGEITKGGTV